MFPSYGLRYGYILFLATILNVTIGITFSFLLGIKMRLDSNIEWKSLNNTYLYNFHSSKWSSNKFNYFFQFEDHGIGKFSNNIDFRKPDFLSEEKISKRSAL